MVRMAKNSGEDLGIEIGGGSGDPLVITRLVSGSVAAASGMLSPGDEIIAVCWVSLLDLRRAERGRCRFIKRALRDEWGDYNNSIDQPIISYYIALLFRRTYFFVTLIRLAALISRARPFLLRFGTMMARFLLLN
jgi:hypothetical protein